MKKIILFLCLLTPLILSAQSAPSFQIGISPIHLLQFLLIGVLIVFALLKGKDYPKLAAGIFFGLALLIIIFSVQLPDSSDAPDGLHSTRGLSNGLIILALLFLIPGGIFLYKAIQKNKDNTVNQTHLLDDFTKDNSQLDIYTQIKNLNELKEKGIITETEFQDKKQKLLSKIE